MKKPTKNQVSFAGAGVLLPGAGVFAYGLSLSVGEDLRSPLLLAGAITIVIGFIIMVARWIVSGDIITAFLDAL